MRRVQKPVTKKSKKNANISKKVLIQGYEGSFHHLVARKWAGKSTGIEPCASFSELVRRLERDTQFDYAIMAIENSIAGSLLPNYGLLEKSSLQIIGEMYFPIKQNLLCLPGQSLAQIKEVHSHPMALLQCADFLEKQAQLRAVTSADTALSAQEIGQQKIKGRAAIAPLLCAELFGLKVLARNIHSDKANYTRFLVLQRESDFAISPDANKASIFFEVEHNVGSLAKVLTILSVNKINLSKVQSFPIVGKVWHYHFHADLEFHTPKDFFAVLPLLKKHTRFLKVLGVYVRGKKTAQE